MTDTQTAITNYQKQKDVPGDSMNDLKFTDKEFCQKYLAGHTMVELRDHYGFKSVGNVRERLLKNNIIPRSRSEGVIAKKKRLGLL